MRLSASSRKLAKLFQYPC